MSRTFGWLGLVAVLAAVCGLENVVASTLLDRAQAAPLTLSVSDTQGTVGRRDPVPITFILHDRESGKVTQWQCISSSDRAPSHELEVDANGLAQVAEALCGPSS